MDPVGEFVKNRILLGVQHQIDIKQTPTQVLWDHKPNQLEANEIRQSSLTMRSLNYFSGKFAGDNYALIYEVIFSFCVGSYTVGNLSTEKI